MNIIKFKLRIFVLFAVFAFIGFGFGVSHANITNTYLPPIYSESNEMIQSPLRLKATNPYLDNIETKIKEKTTQMPEGHLTITRGKSTVIEVNRDIADVLVADPSVVEVGALKNHRLYLIGAAVGDTNVMIFDGNGNPIKQLDVHVRVDESTLQEILKTLFPNETVIAKTVNDDIMLTGNVSTPAVAARIQEVAARFAGQDEAVVNMMAVKGDQQVMIKVRVLEVSRSVLNELGMETNINNTSGDLTSAIATATGVGLTANPLLAVGQLLFDTGSLRISSLFRALERDGLVSTLAEPNLTAISGQNARFLAGGEFPIPTEIDNEGNVTYEYKPFGVSLAFKPVVMSKDRINLQVSTEVSDISDDFSFQIPGITVPGFDVRRAETNVEMASGGTLMMAGLIESKSLNRLNRLPGVKDIPVLGALSSSESFARNESELVVMITSYLVKPFADQKQAAQKVSKEKKSPLNEALIRNLQKAGLNRNVANVAKSKPVGYMLD
jgi:pilus assembly protein CpaC